MLTRRDALKLAAGLAAAAAVPSTLTPAQAAALLDAPLDPGQSPPRRGVYGTDVYDDPDIGGPELCSACLGNGTVATPAPRLAIEAA